MSVGYGGPARVARRGSVYVILAVTQGHRDMTRPAQRYDLGSPASVQHVDSDFEWEERGAGTAPVPLTAAWQRLLSGMTQIMASRMTQAASSSQGHGGPCGPSLACQWP